MKYNLLGKTYTEKDDVIWKINGAKVDFYKNGKRIGNIAIEKLVIDFMEKESLKLKELGEI